MQQRLRVRPRGDRPPGSQRQGCRSSRLRGSGLFFGERHLRRILGDPYFSRTSLHPRVPRPPPEDGGGGVNSCSGHPAGVLEVGIFLAQSNPPYSRSPSWMFLFLLFFWLPMPPPPEGGAVPPWSCSKPRLFFPSSVLHPLPRVGSPPAFFLSCPRD